METRAAIQYTATARRLGIAAATIVVGLALAYAPTLIVGYLSLENPDQPIGDPMFTILEILIIAMMPAMVALMAAVHAWAPAEAKTLSLTALVFMVLMAGLTSSLHFAILTLSRQPEFVALPWFPLFFSFRWPSVPYALDIMAWDVFFALSMLFAAPVFGGSRLALVIRWLMIASGLLSLGGLSGIATGNMQLRNIGVVGYLGVFLFVAVLLGVLFYRSRTSDAG